MAISKITTSGVSADTLTAADLAPNSVDSSELVDGSSRFISYECQFNR